MFQRKDFNVESLFEGSQKLQERSILVAEGSVAKNIYLIQKGCIRAWYNNEGIEVTLQFFFEGDTVTSLESFLKQTASVIYIETVEATEVAVLSYSAFISCIQPDVDAKEWFYAEAVKKLLTHTHRLLALLKNKPYDRYQQLLTENPALLERIPQHYIASYLGITTVSLSRIKNRKK